ncbi:glycerol-3-phosphate dehydrogenase [uncultured Massilia sp.]|uniref:glycerol-3-phosphate dehydrogenase n=1 Tax=uncultured Massilia sp. TaxID=169973 RepID=UPI0025FBBF2A|nr:glycerol-3-phosphate dehydrogenase [uncultured Massilia sp.]
MTGTPKRIDCDLLVVGGGINGAGIARDAAGRGLRVVLCDKDDLGQHTSSASSKLIHGGLRYLEHWEFGLVRKALAEREVLLKSAPHIMRPLRFVMPHAPGQRPAWMIRAGLFLYDHLAPRDFLAPSTRLQLRGDPAGAPLQRRFTRAFSYADAWVDDARLVVLAALDARERGATVLTRTRCVRAWPEGGRWAASLDGQAGQGVTHVHARCLVNAAGPWAAAFLQDVAGIGGTPPLRLVKGSHIVVPRLFAHDDAYLLQQPDGRIVFALPYEGAFTLVGTTDVEHTAAVGALDRVAISAMETAYLCDAVNRSFERHIGPGDVVWSYAGVRPLVGAAGTVAAASAPPAARASRDYRLERDDRFGVPLLSVFGGKITTFRKLAEQAVDLVCPALGRQARPWTAQACLPGGDLYGRVPVARAVLEFDAWLRTRRQQYAWLPPALLERYARAYGTRLAILLSGRRAVDDMGEEIVPGLFEAEADYLVRHEWAMTAADILWRRTKLGLHLPKGAAATLDGWLEARRRRVLAASGSGGW